METLRNFIWNWAAKHRLVYDESVHGLPFVPDIKKKPLPKIEKTKSNKAKLRTAHNVGTVDRIGKDGEIETHIINNSKDAKVTVEGRSKELTDIDRHYLKQVFKYKSMDTVLQKETSFTEVKRRWALGESILTIEGANVGMKERSIAKCFTAFRLSMEHQAIEEGGG